MYCQVADDAQDFYGQSHGPSLYKHLAKHPRVKSALGEWATSFNITADWLMNEAIGALWAWRWSSDERKGLKWRTNRTRYRSVVCADAFELRLKGWEMELMPWAAYLKLVQKEVKKTLADYRTRSVKKAESEGLVRTPRTYSAANLDWFVLYQFAGMSSVQIAKGLRQRGIQVEESAVSKGVKAAATLLGWEGLRTRKRAANRKLG